MIIDLDECKVLLQITDNTYDEKIRQYLPYVQEDIREYCGQNFSDTVIYRASVSALEFVRGSTLTSSTSPDTITDADEYFSTAGFASGQDIIIVGGSNEGYYTLDSVSSGTLTLTSTGELVAQSQSTYYRYPGPIGIARVDWPKALKLAAAKMVWHLLDEPKVDDVKSERLDDYSVTFAGEHEYPKRIINGLKKFRKVTMI